MKEFKLTASVLLAAAVAIMISGCGGSGSNALLQYVMVFEAPAILGNPNDVFMMELDGSNRVNLTNNIAADGTPAISPDGMHIVFNSDRNGSDDIWVMDADGSNPVQLTSTSDIDSGPQWSPDGLRIVF